MLKLREKFFSFSGDDCTIKDMDGKDWFKIEGEAMSISSKRSMTDTSGKEIAGYRYILFRTAIRKGTHSASKSEVTEPSCYSIYNSGSKW